MNLTENQQEIDLLIPYLEQRFPEVIRAATSRSMILIRAANDSWRARLVRVIHQLGANQTPPLLCLDCRDLVDKIKLQPGGWTGTLFLDRLEYLTRREQFILKSFLEKNILPENSGGDDTCSNRRLILGSAVDLRELTRKRMFLPDLYYLISVLELVIPPEPIY